MCHCSPATNRRDSQTVRGENNLLTQGLFPFNLCILIIVCVSVPPKVTFPNGVWINVKEGTSRTLACMGSGIPAPSLRWSRNNRTLENVKSDCPTNGTEQDILSLNYTILFANESDSGWYICTADSPSLGMQYSSSKGVYVNVEGRLERNLQSSKRSWSNNVRICRLCSIETFQQDGEIIAFFLTHDRHF